MFTKKYLNGPAVTICLDCLLVTDTAVTESGKQRQHILNTWHNIRKWKYIIMRNINSDRKPDDLL